MRGVSLNILVSAGEASGDLYAARLVEALRRKYPNAVFFGCAGPHMRAAGVEAVADAESLSVVGLVEVVGHLPRIYGEYRKLVAAVRNRKPRAAILTDSPDFHLRLAAKLNPMGVPVAYLVAPQAWAWRRGRVHQMRRDIARLLCIFPFEEAFFRGYGVRAHYIGHPLTRIITVSDSKEEFFRRHRLDPARKLVVLLPGSRVGEAERNLPPVLEACRRLRRGEDLQVVWAAPAGFPGRADGSIFRERNNGGNIQVIEGETWNALAHADLALAASGTVTIEAALLGTPMVTYYRVNPLSWWTGRRLVRTPYLSMVNLVAGREVTPELMQSDMTPERLEQAAAELLGDRERQSRMKQDLAEVAAKLSGDDDPMERAAGIVTEILEEDR